MRWSVGRWNFQSDAIAAAKQGLLAKRHLPHKSPALLTAQFSFDDWIAVKSDVPNA
jgi:hypothetical protein